MKLTFLGAARTVTGSKYLLETEHKKILIDCGLFQGRKELRLLNWQKFPFVPEKIDAVILTHAHIDHSGCLPLLVKQGFRGNIYCTEATRKLCNILLPDSGYLQEVHAMHANKHGYSKHKPALPLYTESDARQTLKYLHALPYSTKHKLSNDIVFQFNRAGHILGAATLTMNCNNRTIVFSGDLGRTNDPITVAPVLVQHADYLVLESTYGNRLHKKINPSDELESLINRTIKRGGTIVIPSFAVGRTQIILYYLQQLKQQHKIPDIPIYLDSPMAVGATKLFSQLIHEHKLTPVQTRAVCKVAHYVDSVLESKQLDQNSDPKIIVSASGMAEGGRVLHHIRAFGGDAKNSILFTGFQVEGTRGNALAVEHKKEIKIFGENMHINAEITSLDNISAHADYKEILTWLSGFTAPPRKVFITHGNDVAAHALRQKIVAAFDWDCIIVPSYLQQEELA